MATKYKWTSKEVARLATLNGFKVTRSHAIETTNGYRAGWHITSPEGCNGYGFTLESAFWRMRAMAHAEGIAWKHRKEGGAMNAVLAEAYARLLAQGYDAPEGRIRNPGKFEGEALYVPMYWEISLDGLCDEGAEGSVRIPLDEEDWEVWPQLRGQHDLYLRETDQGFVGEISEEEFNSLGMEEGEEE